MTCASPSPNAPAPASKSACSATGSGAPPCPGASSTSSGEAGGKVAFFFPSYLRYLNLRYNYRNHRKIAVIDGKTAYIGGYNIGDDYLGLDPVWGYWRDAAVRIQGNAVIRRRDTVLPGLELRGRRDRFESNPRYFPISPRGPGVPIQVVSGGPDTGSTR